MSRKVLAKFLSYLIIKKKQFMKKNKQLTNIHWCERRDASAATQHEMRGAMCVSRRKLQEIMMEEREGEWREDLVEGNERKRRKKDAKKLVKEDCIAEEERKINEI